MELDFYSGFPAHWRIGQSHVSNFRLPYKRPKDFNSALLAQIAGNRGTVTPNGHIRSHAASEIAYCALLPFFVNLSVSFLEF